MLFFAMINGVQQGPFQLEQLADAGIRPDTYVWCKGMQSWQKAGDVPDICRMFRNRIYDLMHPGSVDALKNRNEPELSRQTKADEQYASSRFDIHLPSGQPMLPSIEEIDNQRNLNVPPASMLPWAIIVTMFFFPPTGIVAIYFAEKSRKACNIVKNFGEGISKEEKEYIESLKRDAHDFAQSAKMWIGITFFLGIILYAFLGMMF